MYVKYIRRCLMFFVRFIRSFVRFLLIWSLIHFLVNFGPCTTHILFVCTLHVSIISSWNDVRGRDCERRTILFSVLSVSLHLCLPLHCATNHFPSHSCSSHCPFARSSKLTTHSAQSEKSFYARHKHTHTRASLARDCHFRNLYQIDSTRC